MHTYKKILSTSLIKPALLSLIILVAFAASISIVPNVSADPYSSRIEALQSEIGQYQAQANKLRNQASTLENEISRIAIEQSVIQGQIELNQAKYSQLQQQVEQTIQKINDNKNALGTTIADMYVDDDITPIEMIAGSKNISEYLDKQEYRNSVRDQLTQTISTIKELKAQLDKQKIAIEQTLTDQKNSRDALANKEDEQRTLLAQTNGQEMEYQALSAIKQAESDRLVREQVAFNMNAARRGNSQTLVRDIAGGGGYPSVWANAPKDTLVDDWALYNRECVSYVAWKVASTGRFVPNFNGQGNANQWESYVAKYGIKSGTMPIVGSVAVLYGGAYGHVMYVESVSNDKSKITISEYNYGWSGLYSERSISSSGLTFLYF